MVTRKRQAFVYLSSRRKKGGRGESSPVLFLPTTLREGREGKKGDETSFVSLSKKRRSTIGADAPASKRRVVRSHRPVSEGKKKEKKKRGLGVLLERGEKSEIQGLHHALSEEGSLAPYPLRGTPVCS